MSEPTTARLPITARRWVAVRLDDGHAGTAEGRTRGELLGIFWPQAAFRPKLRRIATGVYVAPHPMHREVYFTNNPLWLHYNGWTDLARHLAGA